MIMLIEFLVLFLVFYIHIYYHHLVLVIDMDIAALSFPPHMTLFILL